MALQHRRSCINALSAARRASSAANNCCRPRPAYVDLFGAFDNTDVTDLARQLALQRFVAMIQGARQRRQPVHGTTRTCGGGVMQARVNTFKARSNCGLFRSLARPRSCSTPLSV